jgi:uncharacterized cupin superfamily protein
MRIIKKEDVNAIVKPEGTTVTYFLFDEYEVHFNEQAPGTIQTWHHHDQVWETIYIIEGELTAQWKEENEVKSEIVKAGDLIESERSSHTFTNKSDKIVKFLVLKQVLKGDNKKEIFKTDKIVDQ